LPLAKAGGIWIQLPPALAGGIWSNVALALAKKYAVLVKPYKKTLKFYSSS